MRQVRGLPHQRSGLGVDHARRAEPRAADAGAGARAQLLDHLRDHLERRILALERARRPAVEVGERAGAIHQARLEIGAAEIERDHELVIHGFSGSS